MARLKLETFAAVRTGGTIQVDEQLTLHPNFFTTCPSDRCIGDNCYVGAGGWPLQLEPLATSRVLCVAAEKALRAWQTR